MLSCAPRAVVSALALMLVASLAACTADARPTAQDFEMRGRTGGQVATPQDDDETADAPEGSDRARLETSHGPSFAADLADVADLRHD